MSDRSVLWLLGDQLNPDLDALADADEVLLIEAHGFADRKPYHAHKLTLVFSAMRHFRDELTERGHDVTYLKAESFGEGLDEYLADRSNPNIRLMRPASHGAGERLRELVAERGGSLDLLESELFWTTPTDWREWTGEPGDEREGGSLLDENGTAGRTYRQENWYRHVRRETGVLMDGDDPVGGEWNYDGLNQETPPDEWTPPERPRFEPDDRTRETHAWVRDRFDTWGDDGLDAFAWPVTREESLAALDAFVREGLASFGRYEDAMVTGEPFLSHSLLSPAINLGLLNPREPVRAVEAAYEERGVEPGAYDPDEDAESGESTTLDAFAESDADASVTDSSDADASEPDDADRPPVPLNAVEGFIRQVLGWREFMRHVYREAMPELATANQLDQSRALPPAYWDGDTDMTCLSEAVGHVREYGYAHHIERLMVLSNFALIYGVDPGELNEWFHLGFVDAYHWVTTPNVVAMGSFGTDVLSSKPYAASGNYVNRMSDHCASCPYTVSRTTGEGACPFNALYWDFLKENEETLRGTGRMGLMYSHVDNKDDEEWTAIRERAAAVRELAANGEL